MSTLSSAIQDGSSPDAYLRTLEHLLAIESIELRPALNEVAQLLSNLLNADKIDVFLLEPETQTLVALGVSDTPMGRQQQALGLDRLQRANGGSAVFVFESGRAYLTGRADQDPTELPGVIHALGVRSLATIPLTVGGERRGVLEAADTEADRFDERDLLFLEAVGRWMGVLIQRADLVRELTQQAAQQARQKTADELIAVLAHDLRNYLTPLRARVEVIGYRAQHEARPADERDAAAALGQLDRMTRMIEQLLDTGRIEHGLFTVSPQPMDLRALVQRVAEAVQAPGRDIRVDAPDSVIAVVDPDRLSQAVENLLANAFHHAPESPVTMALETEEHEGRLWAVLTVTDRGPGIPAGMQARLFEHFAKGERSRGLGLGLYVARKIAEAHDGRLWLDAEYRKGARFRLMVPA